MKKVLLILLSIPLVVSCSKDESLESLDELKKFTDKLNNTVWTYELSTTTKRFIRFSDEYVLELYIQYFNGDKPDGGVYMKLSPGVNIASGSGDEWITEVTVNEGVNYSFTQKSTKNSNLTEFLPREFNFYYNETTDILELTQVCYGKGTTILKKSTNEAVESFNYTQNETNWSTCI